MLETKSTFSRARHQLRFCKILINSLHYFKICCDWPDAITLHLVSQHAVSHCQAQKTQTGENKINDTKRKQNNTTSVQQKFAKLHPQLTRDFRYSNRKHIPFLHSATIQPPTTRTFVKSNSYCLVLSACMFFF